MSRKLRRTIDAGDVDSVRSILADDRAQATALISWGPMLCPCKTEPLHYLSDGPFNQLWNHGKQAELATVLIEAGAPVDGLPTSGETPLHGAASLGEVGVAKVLIENGANIEAKANYPGIPHGTPLDFAVNFGMVEVVDLLVSRGTTHTYGGWSRSSAASSHRDRPTPFRHSTVAGRFPMCRRVQPD